MFNRTNTEFNPSRLADRINRVCRADLSKAVKDADSAWNMATRPSSDSEFAAASDVLARTFGKAR